MGFDIISRVLTTLQNLWTNFNPREDVVCHLYYETQFDNKGNPLSTVNWREVENTLSENLMRNIALCQRFDPHGRFPVNIEKRIVYSTTKHVNHQSWKDKYAPQVVVAMATSDNFLVVNHEWGAAPVPHSFPEFRNITTAEAMALDADVPNAAQFAPQVFNPVVSTVQDMRASKGKGKATVDLEGRCYDLSKIIQELKEENHRLKAKSGMSQVVQYSDSDDDNTVAKKRGLALRRIPYMEIWVLRYGN